MFTFGIFSTHLPYIAFVFFYVYFLIFGIDKASNGEIQLADNPIKIEIHVDDSNTSFVACSTIVYSEFTEDIAQEFFEDLVFKQKWKKLCFNKIFCSQDFPENSLFNRPPPVLA